MYKKKVMKYARMKSFRGTSSFFLHTIKLHLFVLYYATLGSKMLVLDDERERVVVL